MTKEAFMNRCQSEFHCTPEAAERWCGWADDLHECDSGKADPKTGEVEEGDDPIITAEEFLDQFMERLEVIAYAYGEEIATRTMQSGCYFPWEMVQAAKFIQIGGDPDKAREISAESGLFEETEEDEKTYKKLRWAMMKERIHGQHGETGIPVRSVWMLVDRAEQEFKSYIQAVIQLSAREICDRSMEIGAKESLLRSFICDACDLREEILRRIMDEPKPLNALYQFMQAKGNTWQMLEGSLRNTLEMYNSKVYGRMVIRQWANTSHFPGKT